MRQARRPGTRVNHLLAVRMPWPLQQRQQQQQLYSMFGVWRMEFFAVTSPTTLAVEASDALLHCRLGMDG